MIGSGCRTCILALLFDAARAGPGAKFGDVPVDEAEQWHDGFFVKRIVAVFAADLDMHELAGEQLIEAVRYGGLLDAGAGGDVGHALVASALQKLQYFEASVAGESSKEAII